MAKGTPNEGINGTLANGLIAHWCFNDGSLADISGNGYHLTKVGTVNTVADKDGQTGQAMEFVEYDNSLETSYIGSPVNPYISVWVKTTTAKTNHSVYNIVSIRGIATSLEGYVS